MQLFGFFKTGRDNSVHRQVQRPFPLAFLRCIHQLESKANCPDYDSLCIKAREGFVLLLGWYSPQALQISGRDMGLKHGDLSGFQSAVEGQGIFHISQEEDNVEICNF